MNANAIEGPVRGNCKLGIESPLEQWGMLNRIRNCHIYNGGCGAIGYGYWGFRIFSNAGKALPSGAKHRRLSLSYCLDAGVSHQAQPLTFPMKAEAALVRPPRS